MRDRKVLTAALTVAVATSALLAGTPAMAAPQCPQGSLCVFDKTGFGGGYHNFTGTMAVYAGKFTGGGNLDNGMDSVINNTRLYVYLYEDKNYFGKVVKIDPGKQRTDLGSFNNKVSSHYITSRG